MELLFKQKMFSWFGAFEVFDTEGNTVYTVKGKLALGHKLQVYNAAGVHIATLREELMHLMPHFKIMIGDREAGTLKGKLSLLKQKFEIEDCGWQIQGDVLNWNYTVLDKNDNLVMAARKKIWHMTDTYALEIENPGDALMCLMVVLGIDAVKADTAAAASASS